MSTYSNRLQPALQNLLQLWCWHCAPYKCLYYYNVLFCSSTRDRYARRIYRQTFSADENHS